jgi:RNA polymerase sigma-70 factor (sigma-E family)
MDLFVSSLAEQDIEPSSSSRQPPPAGRGRTVPDTVFTEFVLLNTATLRHTAFRLTGSASAAEELVQDTLVHLYPRWESVQNAEQPVAYVRRSIQNQFLMQRRRTRNREVLTDAVPERAHEGRPEGDFAARDEMWGLLNTLSARQRAALILRYYHGLRDAEIAEALGQQTGPTRSLIFRALANLRRAMQSAGQPCAVA